MSNKQLPALQQMITKRKGELAKMLPEHIKPETFERAAFNAIMRNPELNQCDPTSVYDSLMRCAQDGLIPDNREAAIVVYGGRDGKKAQYQPMIDGVLKRVRQSGIVENISAKAVFENDEFEYWFDEHGEHIKYKPTFGEKGNFLLAFAYAKLKGGEMVVEVMPKDEIDRVRKASKTGSSQYSPWAQWYDRMAVKSVYHRLARRLPSNSEVTQMVEAIERDIDASFEQAKDVTPKKTAAESLLESPAQVDDARENKQEEVPSADDLFNDEEGQE